jgi:very-short-patch-repair endonuclease
LADEKIDYVQQKSFDDCKNPNTNRTLKFDFYIPHKNILIEFDGSQHFLIGKIKGKHNLTPNELKNIQFKDNIKNNYAMMRGIQLARISYFKIKSIPSIMEQLLK